MKKNLITKWFFLYEPDLKNNNTKGVIRLRYCTKRPKDVTKLIDEFKSKNNLQIQAVHEELFSKYYESKEDFTDEEVLEAFANIMTEVSELAIGKLKGINNFSNFTWVKKLSHCIYNILYGLDVETYYLLKRLGYELNTSEFKDDPEQTLLDDKNEVVNVSNIKMTFSILVPIRKQ